METETLRSPDQLKEDIQHLKDWISKEPHLPKIENEDWLKEFLYHNKYSLEKSKTKIDNYYSLRDIYPRILKNRDPLGSDIAGARVSLNVSLADHLTADGGKLVFFGFHSDPSIFNYPAILKRIFMIFDTMLFFDKHLYSLGIIDLKNLSYQHFLKALPFLKVGIEIFFKAYSKRVKSLHVINTPFGLEIVLKTFRKLLPKKLNEKFFVHSSTAELFQILDETIVCSDFGGKGPGLSTYDEYTAKLLEEHRNWFLEQDKIQTTEQLQRKFQSKSEEMKGSFKKMEVD